MHAKDFFINKRTDWQTVKDVRKNFPEFDRVAALAFIVEAINSINLRALVIASQQEEVLRIFDLEAQQQRNRFNRLLASIDVVT